MQGKQDKTTAGIIDTAKLLLEQCTTALLSDINNVAEEMNQLLSYQSAAIETAGADVDVLSTRLANAQRRHLHESLHEMSAPNPKLRMNSTNSTPIIRQLELSEVLPPDLLRKMQGAEN